MDRHQNIQFIIENIFPEKGNLHQRLNKILDQFSDKELIFATRVIVLKRTGKMGAKDLKSLNRILEKYGGRIDINVQLINDNELLLTEEFVFLS